MHIVINDEEELQQGIVALNNFSENGDLAPNESIQLIFGSNMITDKVIAQLAETEYIKAGREIDILPLVHRLTPNQRQSLFSQHSFVASLVPDTFIKLIPMDEKMADLVLEDKGLKAKLNCSPLAAAQQTFENSCSARAIMKALETLGKLPESDRTRHKELQIYRQIWLEPGGIADPRKISEYLQKEGIDVIAVEISCRVKSKLKDSPDLSPLYGFFESASFKQRQQLVELEEKVNQLDTIMLVSATGPTDVHVTLGRKVNDKFLVIDSATAQETEYDSFQDFFKKEQNFVGIAFQLRVTELRRDAEVRSENTPSAG